ncbi:nucleotidyl transferase AbiEii/AbiGii toxin family protein [Vibrio sp. E150_018]
MSNYQVDHHQVIESALKQFNADYFIEHNILFGGGTRIALELNEFRESIDIDFLCPDKKSYRAVREQVTNRSLGALVTQDFEYAREIRADRDAVRTWIDINGTKVKLEFVSCDNWSLQADTDNTSLFPLPFLDQVSCFYTKLTANSDRKLTEPYKDILDLLMMYREWGDIPQESIDLAEAHYGKKVILPDLIVSLDDIIKSPEKYVKAAKNVKMSEEVIDELIREVPILLKESISI